MSLFSYFFLMSVRTALIILGFFFCVSANTAALTEPCLLDSKAKLYAFSEKRALLKLKETKEWLFTI